VSEALKTVIYDGPYNDVDLVLPDGETRNVEKGKGVKVPAEIADNLLEQGIWIEPKKSGAAGTKEDQ
jgi:hypothetical protein